MSTSYSFFSLSGFVALAVVVSFFLNRKFQERRKKEGQWRDLKVGDEAVAKFLSRYFGAEVITDCQKGTGVVFKATYLDGDKTDRLHCHTVWLGMDARDHSENLARVVRAHLEATAFRKRGVASIAGRPDEDLASWIRDPHIKPERKESGRIFRPIRAEREEEVLRLGVTRRVWS